MGCLGFLGIIVLLCCWPIWWVILAAVVLYKIMGGK